MPNFGVWNRVIFFSQDILNQNCILHRTILVLCCNLLIKSHNYQINKVPKTAKKEQKWQNNAKNTRFCQKVLLNNLEMMPKTVEKKSMLPLVNRMEKNRQFKAEGFFFSFTVR